MYTLSSCVVYNDLMKLEEFTVLVSFMTLSLCLYCHNDCWLIVSLLCLYSSLSVWSSCTWMVVETSVFNYAILCNVMYKGKHHFYSTTSRRWVVVVKCVNVDWHRYLSLVLLNVCDLHMNSWYVYLLSSKVCVHRLFTIVWITS